jgi:hypothetical protein
MGQILRGSMERFDYSIPIVSELEVGNVWGFSPEISNDMIDNWTNEQIVEYIESKSK